MSANLSQLNDLRSYSRLWLGEFIELYQAEECLWQPKHPDYSNHSVRNKAYDKLVEKLKEVEPSPDRAMVVRKINSLRSAFRREFRKTSSKSNYETRLWYYDKLLFIADQNSKRLSMDSKPPKRELGLGFDEDDTMDFETDDNQLDHTGGSQQGGSDGQPEGGAPGGGVSTVTVNAAGNCVTLVKSESQLGHHHHHAQEQAQQQQAQQIHLQQQHAHHAAANQPQHTTAVKVLEITSLDSNSQREIQQAVNSLEHQHQMQQQLHQHQGGQATATAQLAQLQHHQVQLQPLFSNSTFSTTPAPTTTHRQEDEYDAIGVNVASKLRVMNPTQRIIAEKLISDVLFNAQLNSLTMNSSLAQ